jgi:hypothetical protein
MKKRLWALARSAAGNSSQAKASMSITCYPKAKVAAKRIRFTAFATEKSTPRSLKKN